MPTADHSNAVATTEHDVVIIGAGISGIYQLYRLRLLGFDAQIVEAGDGVGGVWYWNRYPRACSDSEIYTYGYFFSRELWQEWEWSEHFAQQPELERYLNFVVDKFELRDRITLSSRITSCEYDAASNRWIIAIEDGRTIRARVVVSCTGILSAPFIPEIEGSDDFQGQMVHTGRWPREGVDVRGKRVAVIGTGSSGVQLIPPVAAEAAELVVYQRTPSWCAPLNNSPITAGEQAELKASQESLYALTRRTPSGLVHESLGRSGADDTPEQRHAEFERIWAGRGHSGTFGNYADIASNRELNEEFCEFMAGKIRALVNDPATADKLIPHDHVFGGKRPPLITGYYETYNRDNVELVDLRANPVERITERGIVTADREREFDIIVWATGFDAVVGSILRLGISGPGGSLNEYWSDGPRTFLGLMSPGFPNFVFVGGPHSTGGNIPRSTENQVDFVTDLLEHMRLQGLDRVEATEQAEHEWTEHVYHQLDGALLPAESNWNFGTNIPGRTPRLLMYRGGQPTYRNHADDVVKSGYEGFTFTKA